MRCKDIVKIMEELAPVKYAEDWDNVGLLVGSREKEVRRIMIALDATEEVISQAAGKQTDLLITHHPMIFSPMKRITQDDFHGKRIISLIQNDISYYAAHTNFDTMVMAGEAAKKLNINHARVLETVYSEKLYKIVVFVPADSADKVRDVMMKEGAGHIGEYSHCSYNLQGIGTYMPLEGTNPYIGKINELSFTPENRIETISTKDNLDRVISTMLRVHPYEEPAYDVYELHQSGKREGIGRYGYLDKDITLECLAKLVKERFGIDTVKVAGDLKATAASVAVSPGAGKSMVKAALNVKADVLITGDIDHHTAIDAMEQGLSIIDAGHFGTEYFMVDHVKQYLQDYLDKQCNGISEVDIIQAEEKTPFRYL